MQIKILSRKACRKDYFLNSASSGVATVELDDRVTAFWTTSAFAFTFY
jgi:hypothetical protein